MKQTAIAALVVAAALLAPPAALAAAQRAVTLHTEDGVTLTATMFEAAARPR